MSFLRHLSEEAAFKTLEEGLKYKEWITAVGLDSSEGWQPAGKFPASVPESTRFGLPADSTRW